MPWVINPVIGTIQILHLKILCINMLFLFQSTFDVNFSFPNPSCETFYSIFPCLCPAVSRCSLVHLAGEDQKEEKALLQAAAGWTWERVSDEWVHQQTKTEGALRQAGLERPTSENLVSEPADEEEAADDARTSLLRVLKDAGVVARRDFCLEHCSTFV